MVDERKVPLFDVSVYFFTDRQESKDFINTKTTKAVGVEEKQMDNCKGCCYWVTDAEGMPHRLMCVFDGGMNTAIHEAVHMAWITLDYCCVKITQRNDEPLAYLSAWLAEQMVMKLFPPDPEATQ